MSNRGRLAIALAITLSVMLFASSCTKKVVRTQAVQTQTVSTTQPEVRKLEVQKAPEKPAEQAGQAVRPEKDRPGAQAAAGEAAKWVFVNEHIPFEFDSSLLSDQAREILRGKAEYLRTNPNIMVTVEGHCDERGSNAYNAGLGQRRAESVKTFLVDMGIGTVRLNAVSYGKERPVVVGHNEDSWAKNRRAQLVIR